MGVSRDLEEEKTEFKKTVIKGALITDGKVAESERRSHLLLCCMFGQDITFYCMLGLFADLDIEDPAVSYLGGIE